MKTALRSRHVIVLIVIVLCIGLISGCLKSKGGGGLAGYARYFKSFVEITSTE